MISLLKTILDAISEHAVQYRPRSLPEPDDFQGMIQTLDHPSFCIVAENKFEEWKASGPPGSSRSEMAKFFVIPIEARRRMRSIKQNTLDCSDQAYRELSRIVSKYASLLE